MASFLRGARGEEYSAPKTMLGFYAGVLAILEAGVVAAIAVLATQKELRYLILPVLIFGAVILIALVGVVVWINLRDPSKLQLGQMTGREFIEYQRLTLGDSTAGEFIEEIPVLRPEPGKSLPRPSQSDEPPGADS